MRQPHRAQLRSIASLLLALMVVTPASAQTSIYAEVSAFAMHTQNPDNMEVFRDSDCNAVEGSGPFPRISAIRWPGFAAVNPTLTPAQ